ncbi:MAG: hypothetical protein LCH26_08785 [Proteobacteria bacterium]|nr:hypothetical protein [Pseudomonadota bacterium]
MQRCGRTYEEVMELSVGISGIVCAMAASLLDLDADTAANAAQNAVTYNCMMVPFSDEVEVDEEEEQRGRTKGRLSPERDALSPPPLLERALRRLIDGVGDLLSVGVQHVAGYAGDLARMGQETEEGRAFIAKAKELGMSAAQIYEELKREHPGVSKCFNFVVDKAKNLFEAPEDMRKWVRRTARDMGLPQGIAQDLGDLVYIVVNVAPFGGAAKNLVTKAYDAAKLTKRAVQVSEGASLGGKAAASLAPTVRAGASTSAKVGAKVGADAGLKSFGKKVASTSSKKGTSLGKAARIAAAGAVAARAATKSEGISEAVIARASASKVSTARAPAASSSSSSAAQALTHPNIRTQAVRVPGIQWGMGNELQGYPFEDFIASRFAAEARLPAGFRTLDVRDLSVGLGVSVKTIDTLTPAKLREPKQVYQTLRRYVNDLVDFKDSKLLGVEVKAKQIPTRVLEVGIPYNTQPAQMAQVIRVIEYGAENGIIVKVTKVLP